LAVTTTVLISSSVKSGAWPLLEKAAPGLASLPTYRRNDGQDVRYLPVAPADQEALPISAVLLLARKGDGDAHIAALEPLEALKAILGSAYSPSGALEPHHLEGLVDALNTARIGRLAYASLETATDAVKAFVA